MPGAFLKRAMKQTILLVEDSKVQKLATERILHRAGHLVLLAEDGEEALRLARECVPDLILLDLLLPKIGGEEVLYELKGDRETQRIPVVVLSQLPPITLRQADGGGSCILLRKVAPYRRRRRGGGPSRDDRRCASRI